MDANTSRPQLSEPEIRGRFLSVYGAASRARNDDPRAAMQRAGERWDHDPVKFAADLGVELSRVERKALRRAMRTPNGAPGKRERVTLEAVRLKIERALQAAHAAATAAAETTDAVPAEVTDVE